MNTYLNVYRIRFLHKLGLHRWIYGGRKVPCTPKPNYTIIGTRYCWMCKKREYYHFGLGKKAGWYLDTYLSFQDKKIKLDKHPKVWYSGFMMGELYLLFNQIATSGNPKY